MNFIRTSDHNYYVNMAVSYLKSLYQEAGTSGNEALLKRVKKLPRGNYGPHTDNHFEDCGHGSHNDSPQAHFDLG